MWRKVELQTMTGELVYRSRILDYPYGFPVLLHWGSRSFLIHGLQGSRVEVEIRNGGAFLVHDPAREVIVYREAFVSYVVDAEPAAMPGVVDEDRGGGESWRLNP